MESRSEYDLHPEEHYGGITPEQLADCRKLLRLMGASFPDFVELVELAAERQNATASVVFKQGCAVGAKFELYKSWQRGK